MCVGVGGSKTIGNIECGDVYKKKLIKKEKIAKGG